MLLKKLSKTNLSKFTSQDPIVFLSDTYVLEIYYDAIAETHSSKGFWLNCNGTKKSYKNANHCQIKANDLIQLFDLELSTDLDLFDLLFLLPEDIQSLANSLSEEVEIGDPVKVSETYLARFKELGYEFNYDLSGEPYDLKPL